MNIKYDIRVLIYEGLQAKNYDTNQTDGELITDIIDIINNRFIPDTIFYKKELADAVRYLVINSPCTREDAINLLKESSFIFEDTVLIGSLMNVGMKKESIERAIKESVEFRNEMKLKNDRIPKHNN